MRYWHLLAIFLYLNTTSAMAASFPCNRAKSQDEIAICNSEDLSKRDEMATAAYKQALKVGDKAELRALARSLLSERGYCGADQHCIAKILDRAISHYKEALLGPAYKASKIYYGSRAGMHATIVKRRGIDTKAAVIEVEHTRLDAEAFCRDYVQEITESCIAETLTTDTGKTLSGNCETGVFTTLGADQLIFLGRSGGSDSFAEYRIMDTTRNEALDGSMASGYDVALDQFRALCPSRLH